MNPFDSIRAINLVNPPCSLLQLDRLTFDHGYALPASYKEFMLRFGFGRVLGLLLVYSAEPSHPDSLFVRAEWVRKFLLHAVQDDVIEYEASTSSALALRLFPFAASENGKYFWWLPGPLTAPGEYPVYVTAARMAGLRYAAADLKELVALLTSGEVRRVLGPGYAPLPLSFEALG